MFKILQWHRHRNSWRNATCMAHAPPTVYLTGLYQEIRPYYPRNDFVWGWCKNEEHPLYCTSTKNLNESFLTTITDHPQERRIVNQGFWRTWWTFKFEGLELWMLKVLEIIHKATQNVIVCIDFISKILKPRLDSVGWQPHVGGIHARGQPNSVDYLDSYETGFSGDNGQKNQR